MGTYKKMLVCLDGSESAFHVLKESLGFASDEKSWITVTCIAPPHDGDIGLAIFGDLTASMRRSCEDALLKAREMVQAERVLAKMVLEEGEAHEKIIELAISENCELIVMGRRGLSDLERMFVGSVTARVIGHSPIDVLVVPEGARIGWGKILVAVDGSKYSNVAVLRAINFARSYGGELKAVSVVDVPPELYEKALGAVDDLVKKARTYVEGAVKLAENEGIKAEAIVKEGTTYKVILETARELGVDAIVMGSHGRTGLKRLLMGSVTEKVIGYSDRPVLVVK
ncbi:MAG: universal stress protein [Dissulfurimicrobium sp.]|uniref:universal stress protein n=1 Tax=Dissulfurimicrobium TaxID=1769732 RepID=UPI003C752CD3